MLILKLYSSRILRKGRKVTES